MLTAAVSKPERNTQTDLALDTEEAKSLKARQCYLSTPCAVLPGGDGTANSEISPTGTQYSVLPCIAGATLQITVAHTCTGGTRAGAGSPVLLQQALARALRDAADFLDLPAHSMETDRLEPAARRAID